jgi:hypothetical protein
MKRRIENPADWGRSEGYRRVGDTLQAVAASNATIVQQPWLYGKSMVLEYYLLSEDGALRLDDRRWAKGLEGGGFVHSVSDDGKECEIDLSEYPVLGRIETPCFEIGSPNNWGHWIADTLPKLMTWESSPELRRRKLVFGPLSRMHQETLALLGIDPGQHIVIGDKATPRGRYLFADIALADPVAKEDGYVFVRNRLQAGLGPAMGSGGERLFFSRGHLFPRQRIFNQDPLEAHLRAQGFAVVHGESLSVQDAVNLMRGAKLAVSTIGAAFGNLILAPDEAELICLMPKVIRENEDNLFFSTWLSYYRPFQPRLGIVWGDYGEDESNFAKAHGLALADMAASYDLAQLDQALMLAEKRLMLKSLRLREGGEDSPNGVHFPGRRPE